MASKPTGPLAHVLAGIDHANGHIEYFEMLAGLYVGTRPCKIVVEDDINPPQKVYKIRLIDPIPTKLAFVAFDAVNNLRSCLDHAAFTIARAAGRAGRNAHFPFGLEAIVANDHASGVGRSRDIPLCIFSRMLAFQPRKGGNDFLWALNELCNGSKHEVVSPMGFAIGGIAINGLRCEGLAFEQGFNTPWDRTKNEVVFARIHPKAKLYYNLQISTRVTLGDAADMLARHEATSFLKEVSRQVRAIVTDLEIAAIESGLLK